MEAMCARSEHSSGEAFDKLYQWGIPNSESERIVNTLIANRFIDDVRFTEAFVNEKIEFAGWGRRKISAALFQKRVDKEIVNEALEAVDMQNYYGKLLALLKFKANNMADSDTYEGRTRLFRYAASRGFESELISKAIRELINS